MEEDRRELEDVGERKEGEEILNRRRLRGAP